jgi:hypothetical protein
MVWAFAPLAHLPYHAIRRISFCAEWGALLISMCLLARSIPQPAGRVVFLLGCVAFVVISDFWRRHLCAGQTYVFQLLALSVAISLCSRHGLDFAAAGIALAALALMRPNLLLFLPALVLLGCWRAASTMFGVFAACVAATIPFMNSQTWFSYLAMGDTFWRPQSLDGVPPLGHTGLVEGENFLLPNWLRASTTFAELYERLQLRLPLPALDLGTTSKILMLVVGALLLLIVFMRRKRYSSSAALALVVAMSLDTEYFLPKRWEYADVMLLAPLALTVPMLLNQRRPALAVQILVLLGLVAGQMGLNFLSLYVATALRTWLVMAGATLLAIVRFLADEREPQTSWDNESLARR